MALQTTIPLTRAGRRYINNEVAAGSYVPVNQEAANWVDHLSYYGGVKVDDRLYYAHDVFMSNLKAAGLLNKIISVNTFAWSALNNATNNQILSQTPIYSGLQTGTGVTPWQSSGGTPSVTRNGYSPNGNNYLNCGLYVPTAMAGGTNSHGMSFYSPNIGNTGMVMGSANGYTYDLFYQGGGGSGTTSWTISDMVLASAWNTTTLNAQTGKGFYSFSRTGASFAQSYAANSVAGFTVQSSSAAASTDINNVASTLTIFQLQPTLDGAWYSPTLTCSFAAFHQGLSTPQTFQLYNAVQTLRVMMGGGYA